MRRHWPGGHVLPVEFRADADCVAQCKIRPTSVAREPTSAAEYDDVVERETYAEDRPFQNARHERQCGRHRRRNHCDRRCRVETRGARVQGDQVRQSREGGDCEARLPDRPRRSWRPRDGVRGGIRQGQTGRWHPRRVRRATGPRQCGTAEPGARPDRHGDRPRLRPQPDRRRCVGRRRRRAGLDGEDEDPGHGAPVRLPGGGRRQRQDVDGAGGRLQRPRRRTALASDRAQRGCQRAHDREYPLDDRVRGYGPPMPACRRGSAAARCMRWSCSRMA